MTDVREMIDDKEEEQMVDRLRFKGMALALAVALAVGTPAYVAQTPVEVSAKAVKKGLRQEKGKYYFYKNGVKVKDAWQTVKKKKYYLKKNGEAAVGWNKIGKKAYYFTDKAVMVKNKKIDRIRLNSKGEASLSKRANTLILVQSVLDKNTKSTQSKEQKLKACYNYMVKKCGYGPQPVVSGRPSRWEIDYAYKILKDKKGNCYNHAAGFALLARGCGYKAEIIVGKIQKPGETLRDHAWVMIGDKVYDPQTEQDLKDRGMDADLFGRDPSDADGVMYAMPDAR